MLPAYSNKQMCWSVVLQRQFMRVASSALHSNSSRFSRLREWEKIISFGCLAFRKHYAAQAAPERPREYFWN
jgi:hypothetical protein